MSLVLADAADVDRAKQIDLEYMSVDDSKRYVVDGVNARANNLVPLQAHPRPALSPPPMAHAYIKWRARRIRLLLRGLLLGLCE